MAYFLMHNMFSFHFIFCLSFPPIYVIGMPWRIDGPRRIWWRKGKFQRPFYLPLQLWMLLKSWFLLGPIILLPLQSIFKSKFMFMCVYVCTHVCNREREYECVCVYLCVRCLNCKKKAAFCNSSNRKNGVKSKSFSLLQIIPLSSP